MAAVICGSLAFDAILGFDGRFSEQILAHSLNKLSVSFLMPHMRREFGGCAGNVAYSLNLLGGKPIPVAALGHDGQDYLQRFRTLGIDTSHVRVQEEALTAQAVIMTDAEHNQITGFHPGAMGLAHLIEWQPQADWALGIVSPDGRDAMLKNAERFNQARIPFVFDPGQGLPMFNGDELREFVRLAQWLTVNEYEADMLVDRTGSGLAELSKHVMGLVVTLGANGCDVWQDGAKTHVPPVKADAVLDPTGCGDAFRGGLLYGLEQGWPLVRSCALGNRLGALKIAHRGGQNHLLDREAILQAL
jgi:adenosine kinase